MGKNAAANFQRKAALVDGRPFNLLLSSPWAQARRVRTLAYRTSRGCSPSCGFRRSRPCIPI
jgi:hypothetical protein